MTGGRAPASDRLGALEAALRRRFRVVETEIPLHGRTVRVLHPASAEELIDERDFARDERLPYWAELWPSARVLGERLLASGGAGRTLVELGCGAGLVSVCAAIAGYRVTATDYYEDATRFARVNGRRNRVAVDGRLLDWRALPADLPRADVVVASDVLYERPYGTLVARAIAALLAGGGRALVADPGRVAREEFERALPDHGLALAGREAVPFVDGPVRQTIVLLRVAWATAP